MNHTGVRSTDRHLQARTKRESGADIHSNCSILELARTPKSPTWRPGKSQGSWEEIWINYYPHSVSGANLETRLREEARSGPSSGTTQPSSQARVGFSCAAELHTSRCRECRPPPPIVRPRGRRLQGRLSRAQHNPAVWHESRQTSPGIPTPE